MPARGSSVAEGGAEPVALGDVTLPATLNFCRVLCPWLISLQKRDLFIIVAGVLYSPCGAGQSLRDVCQESYRTGSRIRKGGACICTFKMFKKCSSLLHHTPFICKPRLFFNWMDSLGLLPYQQVCSGCLPLLMESLFHKATQHFIFEGNFLKRLGECVHRYPSFRLPSPGYSFTHSNNTCWFPLFLCKALGQK